MLAGRPLLIWSVCYSVLLLMFVGAQMNHLVLLLAGVLAPLPVLVVGWRLGDWAALVLALAVAAVILAFKPGLAALGQNLGFFSLLLMGVLLSFMEHRGIAVPQAIILTVLILSGLGLLVVLGQAFHQGVSLQAILAQKVAEIMGSLQQVLGEAGAAETPLIPGIPQTEIEVMLQQLLPSLAVTNTGLVAWLNVLAVRQLAFIQTGQPPEPPLYHWALPEWLIFVVLGAGFLLFVPVAGLRYLSLNLLLILAVLYFSQGVAVVASWLIRLRLPRPLRFIGYLLMFVTPMLFFVIITLGMLDLWLDFRRLHQQTGDA